MSRIFGISAFLLAVNLLMSCGYFEDDSPYPPIEKEKLVGCWVAVESRGSGWGCDERCFSTNNFFYSRKNTDTTSVSNFLEIKGTYTVNKNRISFLVSLGNNVEKPDSSIKNWEVSYALIRDTLYSISDDEQYLEPFTHANASNTCGPHWQVFPKPDGWELD
jgi:hypothetical protein